ERDAIREGIVALYRDVDQAIVELTALRNEVRELAMRWKSLQPAPAVSPSLAPRFTGAAPALRADHLNASSHIEKGWSLIALGDYENAERSLLTAMQLAPGDAQCESLLGWAQMLQEKYDEAMLSFQRVLAREPNNALARVNVGYICLKKRIFGEAIEHLSRVLRLDSDRKASLYAHFYMGLVYLHREMYEDAEAFFRRSLQLGPNLIEAHFELGRALWFSGRREEAARAWRTGADANKFNPWGRRCAEMLKHVEGGGEPPRSS
ncbi:MAG TPA: tetratricopeptide repeat protein, partial [Gemmatimonadaceae bacterium]|nr:tetratricopeptide repeat protein [Gemmatimonadaceae bacterium]